MSTTQEKKCKVLVVFDDMIAVIISNSPIKISPI